MLRGLLIMSMNELERLSVIQKIVDKHLTQVLAAKQLGVTDRQVRRLVKDYKLYGAEGVVSKQRGQISNNKYSDEKIEVIKQLVWYSPRSMFVRYYSHSNG